MNHGFDQELLQEEMDRFLRENTQAELARRLGLTQSAVHYRQKRNHGNLGNLPVNHFIEFCNALSVDPKDFFVEDE